MGRKYLLRLATREVECSIAAIHRILDSEDLDLRNTKTSVAKNEVAELTIRTKAPVAFDLYRNLEVTGRFVLVDGYDISGGGIVTVAIRDEQTTLREEARRRDLSWISGEVGPEERAEAYGHRAAVVLVGGLGAAAANVARRVERQLVSDGRHAYLFQPDNLRRGLDADLADVRDEETVRRFGEVARLLVDTGQIVVSLAHTFGEADDRAIETLVHPAPVLRVWVGPASANAPEVDLQIADGGDADAVGAEVVELLKRQGILAQLIGGQRPTYGSYSI
jgi:bifunctional enzyme CysN/CysC